MGSSNAVTTRSSSDSLDFTSIGNHEFLAARKPIGENDVVAVKGRYLVKPDGHRFFLKGMAFPIALPPIEDDDEGEIQGMIDVLEQLASTSDINTIRLYDLKCNKDYSKFLKRAQALGIYVIVPFTDSKGAGVLDRTAPAPLCYSAALFQYGCACYMKYAAQPNVVAAMIGNEVMNSLDSWQAAPCVAAFANDMQRFARSAGLRPIPLLYAAQHDSIGAAVLPEQVMRLTSSYLTACATRQSLHLDDDEMEYGLNLFGINVESWCSSLQTFDYNEDGSESSYRALVRALQNATIPFIFSEMGCSLEYFNKDNGLTRYVRDWKDVPVVLGPDMNSIFSGFCAYAYDGNPMFRMMDPHRRWDGYHTIPPSQDYLNFVQELHQFCHMDDELTVPPSYNGEYEDNESECNSVLEYLKVYGRVELYPMEDMPSWFRPGDVIDKTKKRVYLPPAQQQQQSGQLSSNNDNMWAPVPAPVPQQQVSPGGGVQQKPIPSSTLRTNGHHNPAPGAPYWMEHLAVSFLGLFLFLTVAAAWIWCRRHRRIEDDNGRHENGVLSSDYKYQSISPEPPPHPTRNGNGHYNGHHHPHPRS